MAGLIIEGLKVDALLGVYDTEKVEKQPIYIDITYSYDIKNIKGEEDLSLLPDYSKICETVVAFVTKKHYSLIELLAKDLLVKLKNEYSQQCTDISLTIHKPQAIKDAKDIIFTISEQDL